MRYELETRNSRIPRDIIPDSCCFVVIYRLGAIRLRDGRTKIFTQSRLLRTLLCANNTHALLLFITVRFLRRCGCGTSARATDRQYYVDIYIHIYSVCCVHCIVYHVFYCARGIMKNRGPSSESSNRKISTVKDLDGTAVVSFMRDTFLFVFGSKLPCPGPNATGRLRLVCMSSLRG